MTIKTLVAVALSFFPLSSGPEPPAIMSCQAGRYTENGRPLPAGDYNCMRQPTLSATAIAINVGAAAYAGGDNPQCSSGDTDGAVREIAKAAVFEGAAKSNSPELWSRVQRRANTMGSDSMILATGQPGRGGARCQAFVVGVPMPASKIRVVEFRAHQNSSKDNPFCFQAQLNVRLAYDQVRSKQSIATRNRAGTASSAAAATATTEYALSPQTGGCSIGWSGWQSGMVLEGSEGTVVAGVFKNWSHNTTRTGQLWVWY